MRCTLSSIEKKTCVFFSVEFSPCSFSVIFSSPIWVENYGNCVSTSLFEGVFRPLELLGGIQNMAKLFCCIERKV